VRSRRWKLQRRAGNDHRITEPVGGDTAPQIEADASVKRGRGRPSGLSLKRLLTEKYPDGATAEMLVCAGFVGDFSAALKRGQVKQLEDANYIWIGESGQRPVGKKPGNKVRRDKSTSRFVLRVEQILVGDRLRGLNPCTVAGLKESITAIGLRTPISVRYLSDEEGYGLVAGRHRLQACIELGMTEIEAREESGTELDARLWEIDENLCRAELTELERGEHLAARKAIYQELHPETRR
jgi:uncharacterized ParB-like nuclease family protein